jgi:hypothetical protein
MLKPAEFAVSLPFRSYVYVVDPAGAEPQEFDEEPANAQHSSLAPL